MKPTIKENKMMDEAKLIKLVQSKKDGLRRVQSCLNETNQLIAKELNYSKDLQKKNYLNGLKSHASKLERVLRSV